MPAYLFENAKRSGPCPFTGDCHLALFARQLDRYGTQIRQATIKMLIYCTKWVKSIRNLLCFFQLESLAQPKSAQHSVHPIPGNPGNEQPGQGTPGPWWWDPQRQCAGVGDGRIRMLPRPIGAFSGSLRGLKLVPSKWRYLVPPTTPQGHNANR